MLRGYHGCGAVTVPARGAAGLASLLQDRSWAHFCSFPPLSSAALSSNVRHLIEELGRGHPSPFTGQILSPLHGSPRLFAGTRGCGRAVGRGGSDTAPSAAGRHRGAFLWEICTIRGKLVRGREGSGAGSGECRTRTERESSAL